MQLGLSVSDMKPFGKNKECKNTTNDNCLAPLGCNPKVAGLFQTLCIVQGLSWGMKNYHGAKFGSWLLQGGTRVCGGKAPNSCVLAAV